MNASTASCPKWLTTLMVCSTLLASAVQAATPEVVVAVIDSGVLAEQALLKDRLLPGYDFISGAKNPKGGRSADFSPNAADAHCAGVQPAAMLRTHGTDVASLVAGTSQRPRTGKDEPSAVKILPVRLFGPCGMSRADLLDALAWSAGLPVANVPDNPHPAQVINLSLAGGKSSCGADLQALVNRLLDKQVFIVAAVGNTYGQKLAEPANCEGVISVGAVDPDNRVENYSALDARTVIYAPGRTPRAMGTSYAAPLVSGFIALLLTQQPSLRPTDFQALLPRYSREVQPVAKCPECSPRGLLMSSLKQ